MILKQLKQLTLSAARRNADVVWLARFYSSPAVCQALTTSKAPRRRLSKDDRRAMVESFVSDYRAANAGKFPTLEATHKEVGGGYYIIRKMFQELKLKPKAPLPIVAKSLSDVPASVPNDASSQTLNDPKSHSSGCSANHFSHVVVDPVFRAGRPDTIETRSDQRNATIDSSHPNSDEPILLGENLVITATNDKRETQTASNDEVDSKCESNLVITATHDTTETETAPNSGVDSKCDRNTHLPESKAIVLEESSKSSEISNDEVDSKCESNIVITAAHDKTETETAPNSDVDSKCDSNAHLPESKAIVIEESSKTSETDEKENLTLLGSQESKVDHLEGAAISEKVLPTETRQVSEKFQGAGEVKTGVKSSAWSNIMSFARDFANFLRKG